MSSDAIRKSIESGTAVVGVVGLGYVGAPLAELICRAGFEVLGVDPYITEPPDILGSMEEFEHHADFADISRCDVVSICVPTPLTEGETPDISCIEEAASGIAGGLQAAGKRDRSVLVLLESTTYPGTTREVVLPLLTGAGMKPDKDFYLAYAPERIDPGLGKMDVEKIPRVVGGINSESGELAAAFYSRLGCAVHRVASPEAAEMSKLLENVFRAVNIALVNEISLLCRRMGIDVWEVVEAAATKPFGFMSFKPGPGMGGHCIPVDPFYLAWRAKQFGFYPEFIELAGKINKNMPYFVVEWVAEALNSAKKSIKDSKVLLIGVAYKEDVADTRESPALKIIELLVGRGAYLSYHDAYVPSIEVSCGKYDSQELDPETVKGSDCVVILTAHSGLDTGMIASAGVPVVDTRNVLG